MPQITKSKSISLSIDIHTHILPPQIPNYLKIFGHGGFITLKDHYEDGRSCCPNKLMVRDDGKFFREIEPNCFDPNVRLKDCNNHHVGIQVLSTVPVMFCYWTKGKEGLEIARFLNDHIKTIVDAFPYRFVGLGSVPLQDPLLACKEATRISRELKFPGIQIGSHIGKTNLSCPDLYCFFETCEKENLGLFIHPWDMMGADTMEKYWLPWLVGMPAETSRAACSLIFGGILDRFPKLKISLAHGGGSFPATLGRIQHGHQVRPDLCAIDCKHDPMFYKDRFLFDSLVHQYSQLINLKNQFDSNQICVGSDYPFPLGEHTPGNIIRNNPDLSHEEKELMLWKNAAKWLNLDNDKIKGLLNEYSS